VIPAVLTIGGSDSSCGAGIQADLRVFAAFDIKGCSAITALTAQNPDRISRIEPVSLDQLEAEIRAVFEFYDVRVVKTGMLVDADRIRLIAKLLKELHAGRELIVDPVLVASSGATLLDHSAVDTLKNDLFPLSTLITPNIPEADLLFGREGESVEQCIVDASRSWSLLLKGGHGDDETVVDCLYRDGDRFEFSHPRHEWNIERRHGTGCRLASTIAALIASGRDLEESVDQAIHWNQKHY